MARQIIKQPDGLWAEYSTISDGFIITGATKDQIIRSRTQEAASEAKERCEQVFQKIESGDKPYFQFGLTWEEALENHKRNFPGEELPIPTAMDDLSPEKLPPLSTASLPMYRAWTPEQVKEHLERVRDLAVHALETAAYQDPARYYPYCETISDVASRPTY